MSDCVSLNFPFLLTGLIKCASIPNDETVVHTIYYALHALLTVSSVSFPSAGTVLPLTVD